MTSTIARRVASPLLGLALVALAGLAHAATVDKGELKRLQGKWILVSGQVDGKPVPAKSVKASRMTYKGDTITIFTPHQSKQTMTAKLKRLDPKHHEMDWVRSSGPGKAKTMQAVYEFQGKNSYRVCFDPSGQHRPSGYTSGAGECHILHVWKRAKA